MSEKYKYDPESLQFKKQQKKYGFIRTYMGVLIAGIVIGVAFLFISTYIITTPAIRKMRRENLQAGKEVKNLTLQYERIEKVLKDLKKRDGSIYRAVLESNPTDNEKVNKNSDEQLMLNMLQTKSLNYVADYIQKEIDKTLNESKQGNKYYSDLEKTLAEKDTMTLSVPSIQPVHNENLEVMIYGFGKRIDPFYKSSKEHKGLDYSLPEGTRVFATAGGKVTYADRARKRGNTIKIDHGYGFNTVYAHLDKMLVKAGNKVERGDYIGTVGNTGKSVASHLHYEVHVNGVAENPVNFFFADVSPQQYEKLIIFSSRGGVSLD